MFERRHVRQASFWLAITLIAATSFLAYRGLKDLLAVGSSVGNTQAILLQLERVSSLLKDAESGQRGFIIAGDEAFLDPYRAALTQGTSALDMLQDLTSDSPHLRPRVSRLQQLVGEQLSTLARAIPQHRANGLDDLDLSLIRRSKELMDLIRSEIDGMTAEETRLLDAKTQSAQRQAKVALIALSLGTAVSCAAIIFVFLLTMSEVRHRRRAEKQLVELNAVLEERVAVRTAELAEANEALRRESEQRKRAAEGLRKSNERLSAIISAAPFGIDLLDSNGNVALWNAGAERIFGYASSEIMGRPPPFPVGDDLIQTEDAAKLQHGRQPEGVHLDLPHRAGQTVHVRLFTATIAPRGGAREVLHIMEDLTERRDIEQQLRQSQKMEVIGQLTGGIAHDFNNLLTIILGNLDIAQEQLTAGTAIAENVQAAIKGAMRGADLTQRLLAFARRQTLQPSLVDLNELMAGTVTMLKRMLGETINVSTMLDQELWPTMVDPSQVEDAVLNLAVNARDAMSNGGRLVIETSNVTLDADYVAFNPGLSVGEYVMLSVGDTGYGMPPEVLERAFEPFFTTKEKGRGTGLGLSMIYGFVKQSGGHIKIYSEPGHGTTVRIYLPRARAIAIAEPAAEPAAPVRVSSLDKIVLVVEDSPDVRGVAVRMLGELGYGVIEADRPDGAIEILRARDDIDILFTDVVMPGKRTGYELALEAKTIRPQIRILFTSGYSEGFIKQGTAGLRAQLISKPYRRQDLAAKLQSALADKEG